MNSVVGQSFYIRACDELYLNYQSSYMINHTVTEDRTRSLDATLLSS